MQKSIGQSEQYWINEWNNLTPESEIQMWDYFGLRPYIVKFVPRSGKVIEAGCGLGRYVFYLSSLGIDIEGVDFAGSIIESLKEWNAKKGFRAKFIKSNVLNLNYPDNSLSGYISLGVIEHFMNSPQEALDEAFRVLRPGGVAIISTPSKSPFIFYRNSKELIFNIFKRRCNSKGTDTPFVQYWYRPRKLAGYIKNAGFDVRICKGADLMFLFYEFGRYSNRFIKEGKFGYKFSHMFENTCISSLGAQSITISVKKAPIMYCFICGELTASEKSLKSFHVPVCAKCQSTETNKYYKKTVNAKFCKPYKINSPYAAAKQKKCDFCGCFFVSDEIFEDYGFDKSVCPTCLKKKQINIYLANECVKPIWRNRRVKPK